MEENGKQDWAVWLHTNWLTMATVTIWFVFLSYFVLIFLFGAGFFIGLGLGSLVISIIPSFVGMAFVLFGIAMLIMTALRKIPIFKGMICGFSGCLAGGSFLYVYYVFIMYI